MFLRPLPPASCDVGFVIAEEGVRRRHHRQGNRGVRSWLQ